MIDPVLPLLNTLGLSHRLRLFAPTPPLFTGHLEFRVTRADGSVEPWRFPRTELAPGDPPGSYGRYLFLYLIWDFDQKAPTLGPSLGRYVADQASAAGGSPPVSVEVVQKVVRIPSPAYGIGKPSPMPNDEIPCLRYDVASDQLSKPGHPFIW